jgi:1-acyl-sn-glycerol-3-phosphate acyltransferase
MKKSFYNFIRGTFGGIVRLIFRIRVVNPEKEPASGSYLICANHTGLSDVIIMVAALRHQKVHFMAKKELGQIPVLKKWMDAVDCVFVDRANKKSAHSSLQQAIDAVKDGRSIVIFPEGTRSKNGEIGEFRGGAMKIAMETGAVVVPVLLEGTRDRLEATGNVTAGTVYVTFLDPIETEGLTKEDFFAMPQEIRRRIQAERDAQRENIG